MQWFGAVASNKWMCCDFSVLDCGLSQRIVAFTIVIAIAMPTVVYFFKQLI
jgi:hypothetical protein